MKQTLLWIIALTMICCIASADDSAMSTVGGGAAEPMVQHTSIRMVREVVDVKLGARVGYEWPVFVRCQFEFHNDGPATDVVMGFPEKARAGGDASASGRLRSFKSWVDDKPAKVKYHPGNTQRKYEYTEQYKAWYVKTVHFDKGQKRKVVDMYSARLGTSGSVMSPVGTSHLFDYILRTGANWKGTIGEAIINVDISTAGNCFTITTSPKGCKVSKGKLSWVLKNFEPKQDINITFTSKVPLLNGKPVEDGNAWDPCYCSNGVMMAATWALVGVNEKQIGKVHVLRRGKHILKLQSGSRSATIDGKKITLVAAPWVHKYNENKMVVPLEQVVRLLGGFVKYDSNHRPNVILK